MSYLSTDIDFQAYLKSILEDESYREWQELYTPTTVEDRRTLSKQNDFFASQRKLSPRLKLRVETVKPPKEEQTSRESGEQEELEQLEVLEALRKCAADHVLLIGNPGSGKSASLERLLWEEADKALKNSDAQIPVLVKLRRCTGTIEELIRDFFNRHQLVLEVTDIELLLNQRKLLLLLDGLNELPEAFRIKISNFRDQYRYTTSMIISTRDLSVGGTLNVKKKLKMLPLTKSQMQDFVQGYLGEDGNLLFQRIKGDKLRQFAETPLLLWMLCRIFAQNGKVPANLGLAFREFTQLHDLRIQEDAPVDSKDQWHKLLRHLAFALMQAETLTDFRLSMPREEAENLLTKCLQQEGRANPRDCAERWLRDLLKYHLIQPVIRDNFEEYIEFCHQLLQEYYAAEYLLKIFEDLTDEQLKQNYLNYLKWTEPITLMLALESKEKQILRLLKLALEVDLLLGSRLAGEASANFQVKTISLIAKQNLSDYLKIKLLGETRSEEAISYLESFLMDQESSKRKLVINSLRIGTGTSISFLERILQTDRDFEVRQATLEKLGEIADLDCIEIFLRILANQNEDSNLRSHAGGLLQKAKDIEEKDQINFLLSSILINKYEDSNVRANAALALKEINVDNAVRYLQPVSLDEDWSVNRIVCLSLGEIGSEQAEAILRIALMSDFPNVRINAVFGLSLIRTAKSVNAIIQAIQNEFQKVDRSYHSSEPIPVSFISYRNVIIRYGRTRSRSIDSMIRALGNTRSIKAFSFLCRLAKHEDSEISRSAISGLGKVGGEEAIPILTKILFEKTYSDPYLVPIAMAESLGDTDSLSVILILKTLLDDESPWIRMGAVAGLEKLESQEIVPALTKALKDENQIVRQRAAIAFNNLASDRPSECINAIDSLSLSLKDENADVRLHITQALWLIGDTSKATDALIDMLKQEKNTDVRLWGRQASQKEYWIRETALIPLR